MPALLTRMVYSEKELSSLPVDDLDDADVPDDVRRDVCPTASTLADGDDDDEKKGKEMDDAENWTVRERAMLALDALAETWENELLPYLLDPLNDLLGSGDDANWLRVESEILALGCISEGCPQIVQYMDDLYPMLLKLSGHSRPLVRKSSLWSMSKYTTWLLDRARKLEDGTERAGVLNFLEPTIQCYCQRMIDRCKIVQGAATASLGVLAQQTQEDNASHLLIPYAQPMLQTCVQCLNSYQERNMVLVCDTMAFVIECCKSRHDIVRSPAFLQMMMPPLIARWDGLQNDDDHAFFPLMEGMTSVAAAVGAAFEPFAPPVFAKCITIIEKALDVGSSEYYIDVDPMCVALDLIAGIAEGLGPAFLGLLSASNFLELLLHCLQFHDLDVQQSSFGCLGEVAKACPQYIIQGLASIVPECMKGMEQCFGDECVVDADDADGDDVTNVCNNAIWSVGEIVMKVGPGHMQHFLGPILNK